MIEERDVQPGEPIEEVLAVGVASLAFPGFF
jgi:hypothetical protein